VHEWDEGSQFGEFNVRSMALMVRTALEAIPHFMTAYPGLDLETCGRDLITFFERARAVTKRRR
jgi:hypothetical protein